MSPGSCSGWGDTHFSTFDGTAYSFLDNCTHVLVREIRPRLGDLTILLHGRFCMVPTAHSCPRALSIQYLSTHVVLTTSTGPDGREEGLVRAGQRQAGQSHGLRAGAGVSRGRAQHPVTPRAPRSCSTRSG